MKNIQKSGLLFLAITPVAGLMMYSDYMEAEKFEANGNVIEAKWNTKDHQMSLFKIKSNESILQLHHYRVTLTPEQIKTGDHFSKKSGSTICNINGHPIQCVN